MVGSNRHCPHCKRVTLQFELSAALLEAALGSDLRTALTLSGLRNVTYWCPRCGKVNLALWQPDAQRLDLRDTIKKAGRGES